ncbi:hypothetical protein Hanom_Chr14g01325941 [Helianthus anomalus]
MVRSWSSKLLDDAVKCLGNGIRKLGARISRITVSTSGSSSSLNELKIIPEDAFVCFTMLPSIIPIGSFELLKPNFIISFTFNIGNLATCSSRP